MNKQSLEQILSYCPNTGVFRWKVDRPPRGKSGDIAGYNNGSGYIKISISGKRYYAHRLAFIMMGRSEPKIVDHINGVKHDNSWKNLRGVTQKENNFNRPKSKGVRKRYGKWYARISNDHIGVFDTEKQAYDAYIEKKSKVIGKIISPAYDVQNHVVKKWKYRKQLFNGKTLSQIARENAIPQPSLHYRVHVMGLSIEEAIFKGRTINSGEPLP
jgi:hypothetical protein